MDTNTLINQFNAKVNSYLLQSWNLETNAYGAEYCIGWTDQIDRLTKKGLNGRCPKIRDFKNGKDLPPENQWIQKSNFQRWFDKNRYSYQQLVSDILALKQILNKAKIQKAKVETDASTLITSVINQDYPTRIKCVNFFSNSSFGTQYFKADDEFLFSRLFKDSENNLYIKLSNQLYRVQFKPGTQRTILGNTTNCNTQFWPAFFRCFSETFTKWNELVIKLVHEYASDQPDTSIQQCLLDAGIPRLYLQFHKLYMRQKGIPTQHGTKWVYNNCDFVLKNSYDYTYNYANIIKNISETLLQPVDYTRVPTIPLFSNNEHETAIKHLPFYHPTTNTSVIPKLPPMWQKFLGGERFYDKVMDKMKIATFVTNCLNANYSGRQILVLGGEGLDGKGVFLDVLSKIIGPQFSYNINPKAFAPQNQFGFQNVVNKKFVYLSDCKSVSKLFAEDKFKALTGGDTLSINRKYMSVINWKPQGLCVAIATNNTFYVNSEHGRSRAMPIVFRKNFEQHQIVDKNVMEISLLTEKEQFIQWCFDYKQFINGLTDNNLIHGNSLTICTDEDFKNIVTQVKNKEKVKLDFFQMFKNVCQKQLLNGSKFCNWNQRTETEDEIQSDFNDIFDDIFKRLVDSNELEKYIILGDLGHKFIKPIDLLSTLNYKISQDIDLQRLLTSLDCDFRKIDYKSKLWKAWVVNRFNILKTKRIAGKFYKSLIDLEEIRNTEDVHML